MPKYCPPLSKAPQNWRKGAKGKWTCLGCNRTGLLVRHRHRSWPMPVHIPCYGDRNGSRNEILAHASVSPMDAHLRRHKWRVNTRGYAYRQTWAWRDRNGMKAYVRYNFYLHREVLGLHPDNPHEGHHRDDDPLNCQRWNLEKATTSENNLLKARRNIRVRSLV